jgi:HD-GYP domain-containing protein (c-di-GMP phosphodiesterase class II)
MHPACGGSFGGSFGERCNTSGRQAMFEDPVLYLLPYGFSIGITLGVFLYSWRHRHAPGITGYIWYVGSQVLWIIGFLMEIVTPSLEGKVFWDAFQWWPIAAIAVAFPAFSIDYTNWRLKNPRRTWAFLCIVPAAFLLVVLGDPLHHLVIPNPRLLQDPIYPALTYDFTWVVYGFSIYCQIAALVSLFLLSRHLLKVQKIFRNQILTIVIGFSIPVIGSILIIAGVDLPPYRDFSPFTLAIGNLIIAWGLFHYHTFDILPIARDLIMDNISDLVVVLDAKDRIVDINRAALTTLETTGAKTIGQSAEKIFYRWPTLISEFNKPQNIQTELEFPSGETVIHFEIKSTLLYDRRGTYIGRVFVARDISIHVALERELQEANRSLEQRVGERTRDLAEAYEKTLEGWAKALEYRDKETEGHSRRVVDLTLRLARAAGCTDEDLLHIRRGAILHDIGKMAIPDDILRKSGALLPEELLIVRKHPEMAYQLLAPIPFLRKAADIPYCHHEWWNGKGYPRGLKGAEIPLEARIFAVVDVWDALQSDRPYNKAWTKEKTTRFLKDQAGTQFDPEIVRVFLDMVAEGKIQDG